MTLAVVMVFGLLWGSFANVLIARVPRDEPWITEPSRCPQCQQRIAWYDNIPLVSWVVLAAKCRHCKLPIPLRYPIVELATSLAFGVVYLYFGLTITALAFAYLALMSVVLVVIDIDVHRLPDALVWPSYVIGSALLVTAAIAEGQAWPLGRAAIGLLALGGFYGILWLVYPGGMGFGDVKTAGLLGMYAGFLGWEQLGFGWFAGPIIGGIIVLGGAVVGKVRRKSKIPYGPALITGAWCGYLLGDVVVARYVALVVGS